MKELLELFTVFTRIGGFTFGGGYAMLPIIQEEVVEKRGWATEGEIIDYYAIGQSTPGIIAVNTATFVGYKRKGILGAIVATLGMVFPSVVIISIIANFFRQFQDNEIVRHAFGGIRVAVVALIINAISKMWGSSVKDYIGAILFTASFFVTVFFKISPMIIIVVSAVIGILIGMKRIDEI
ncbi:MAG: chromate transporter [Clostridiales bacterium]|nr:chromate transporter [Clostridiales bacterium]